MSTFSFNPQDGNDSHLLSSAERLELLRAEKIAHRSEGVAQILQIPLATLIGVIALFCIAVFNLSDLGLGDDSDKISIDFTVLIKVGSLALAGGYGLIGMTDAKVRRLMFSFPVVWIWIIFGFYCLGVVNSVLPKETIASALSIACVLMLTTRLLVQVGVKTVLTILFHAMAVFVVVSWFLFLFVPEIGVFEEDIVDGQQFLRMGGLAHPNTLGQIAGMTVVFVCLLHRNYGELSRWRWIIAFLALGALVASVSRTSLVTTALSIAFVYRETFIKREYLPHVLGAAFLGIIGFLALAATVDLGAMLESNLESVSKSGDTEELTSGTGRAEIWAYSMKLIGRSPLFGYGAATSKWYLSDYSLYTHNLILNVAFSTGIFGGFACLTMVIGRIRTLIHRPHPIADSLIAFILFNGIAENVIFSILCGLPTIVWIVALSMPVLDDIEKDDPKKRAIAMEGSQ